jgi:hypothetical protein
VDAGGRRLRKATVQTCNKDDRTAAARVERKGLMLPLHPKGHVTVKKKKEKEGNQRLKRRE